MENDRITKIGKTALTLTFISFMCKIVGFFKNSLLAYYFGTDVVVDAYVMVFSIGNIIFGWMGGFTGNLIPIYKTIYVKQGKNSADRFFLNLSSWLYIITISFMVIFFLMGDKIVSFIAYGFDNLTFF